MGPSEKELPDLAAIFAQLLQRVPREQQSLLIAIAERRAAVRYREWAEMSDPAHRPELLSCAEREEEIARRVESLYPGAAAIQQDIVAKNPDLDDLNRSLFAGRPLTQQFAMQAQGERLGAATWRAFAEHAPNPGARATLLGCAALEEDNATVLERLLGTR
jgi:hypothetical protein